MFASLVRDLVTSELVLLMATGAATSALAWVGAHVWRRRRRA